MLMAFLNTEYTNEVKYMRQKLWGFSNLPSDVHMTILIEPTRDFKTKEPLFKKNNQKRCLMRMNRKLKD